MRLDKQFWLPGIVVFCLGLVGFAQCSHFIAAQDGSGGGSPATSAQAAKNQHVVFLQLKLSKSGAVKEATQIGISTPLGNAAIDAVKHRKFKSQAFSGAREMAVAVDFAPMGGPIPKIQEAMPAGVSGCVTVPERVRVLPFAMQAYLLARADPVYPPEARTQRVEGTVTLHIWIDKDGNVYRAEKVSGSDLLVPAAIESVKQWKYRPYVLNNSEAVEVETMADVKFALSPSAQQVGRPIF